MSRDRRGSDVVSPVAVALVIAMLPFAAGLTGNLATNTVTVHAWWWAPLNWAVTGVLATAAAGFQVAQARGRVGASGRSERLAVSPARTGRQRKAFALAAGAIFAAVVFLIAPAGDLPARVAAGCSALALGLAASFMALAAIRGRWMRPPLARGPMRALLNVLAQRSEQHRYSVGSRFVPPVSRIYVDQTVETASGDAGPDLFPVAEILKMPAHILVTGGPGTGKSTLVSHVTGATARWWLKADGRRDPRKDAPFGAFVALPLRALALADRDIPAALGEAVQDLGVEFSPDSFDRPPAPGVGWLVLVDGLDEVKDSVHRSQVLTCLGQWMTAPPGRFRLMVTTRPLPREEMAQLNGEHVREFQLRPMDRQALQLLSQRWFTAIAERDETAEEIASRFLLHAEGALSELVRIPLIATMCMLIYEDDQRTELPATRAEVYESFVALLASGAAPDPRNFPELAWLLPSVSELTSQLSLSYVLGESGSLFQRAVQWVEQHAPARLPPRAIWIDEVRSLLLGTGVIVSRGRELEYVHPSFAEYLAAGARHFEPARFLEEVQDKTSRGLALFTLARAGSEYDRWLSELIAAPSIEASLAAGYMVADGLFHSDPIRDQAIGRLFELLQMPAVMHESLAVIILLCRFPEVRERLARVSENSEMSPWLRAMAADTLADSNRAQGFRLLRAITSDPALRSHPVCGWAAARLAIKNDVFGSYISNRARREVSVNLAPGAGQIGYEAMRRHAEDSSLAGDERLRAILFLINEGSETYYEEARALLLSPAADGRVRNQASGILLRRGTPQALEVLRDLLLDPGTRDSLQGEVAKEIFRKTHYKVQGDELSLLQALIAGGSASLEEVVCYLIRIGGDSELALAETWLLKKNRSAQEIAYCNISVEYGWSKSGPGSELFDLGGEGRFKILQNVLRERKTSFTFQLYIKSQLERRVDRLDQLDLDLLYALATSKYLAESYDDDVFGMLARYGHPIGLDRARKYLKGIRRRDHVEQATAGLAQHGTKEDLALIERAFTRKLRPAKPQWSMTRLFECLLDRPDGAGLPVVRRILLAGPKSRLRESFIGGDDFGVHGAALFRELLLEKQLKPRVRERMVGALLSGKGYGDLKENRKANLSALRNLANAADLCSADMQALLLKAMWDDHSAEATEILHSIAASNSTHAQLRRSAAEALMERGDPRGPALL